jgi:cytochrome P450
MGLPPGPRGVPGLGSVLSVRSSGILRFLRDLTLAYGDVATYRVPGRRTVLVNRPALARQILLERVDGIRLRHREVTPLELIQWPASHWTRTGDRNESVARRVSQVDSPAAALDRIARTVDACCEGFAAHWSAAGSLELGAAMGALSAGLVRSVLLGHEPDVEASHTLRDALRFALSPARSSRADRQLWQTTVRQLRNKAMATSRYHGDQAAGQARGFAPLVMASYSPMAAALSWITYLLATHPDALADLGDRTLTEAANTPSLKNFVRESLRLYPPAPALVRSTAGPTTLGEYTIPAGTRVLVSPYLLQRHPELWPDPDAFRPQRFSGQTPTQVYLPFGVGPQTCPGKAVGILLLNLTVAALVRRLTFRPGWTSPPRPELRSALVPDRALPVTLSPARAGDRVTGL